MTSIPNLCDAQAPPPLVPTSLWEFVRDIAPVLGFVALPYLKTLCDLIEHQARYPRTPAAVCERLRQAEAELDWAGRVTDTSLDETARLRRRVQRLQRASLRFAAAKLVDTGEAGTQVSVLLLEQLAEEV